MQLPKISIVTPSYNQAKYLPETIESILNQGYPKLEYIIIDGGSSDGSVEIIKQYERHLAYWVSEPDSGQSAAINKGVDKATGDLFNWINSDDVLFPGALQRIAETFCEEPDADLFVGINARSDAEGRITRVSVPPRRTVMSPTCWIMGICQQSTFITTKVLRRVGELREDLHCIMDTELYYRLFATGARYVRVPGLIGMIREHPDAKGVSKTADWPPETERVLREYHIGEPWVNVARAKLRLGRLLDGSYWHSFRLLRKWRGQKPWPGHQRVSTQQSSIALR
jgi:glycosyltransferase involved in cell wall biosynthesis